MLRIDSSLRTLAPRILRPSGAEAAKDLEKPSTGYRIDKAEDDAQGRDVSENRRGQVRDLSQIVQTAQDSTNTIGEGGQTSNETHAELARIAELSKQQAQDAATNELRKESLASLDKKLGEIGYETQRTAQTTETNKVEFSSRIIAEAKAADSYESKNDINLTRPTHGAAQPRETVAIPGRDATASSNPITRAEAERAVERISQQLKQDSPAAMSAQANIRPESALSLIG